ncbi:MAG: hypothetical protein R3F35_07350 [Myxococcota bacterium]
MTRQRLSRDDASARTLRLGLALSAAMLVSVPALAEQFALFGNYTLQQSFSVQRVIPALETFSATGAAPRPVVFPAHAFEAAGYQFIPFPFVPQVAQFEETFTTTQPNAETFAAGSGPGSFSFCPRAGNAANPSCAAPALATGGRNGRISYTAGANQFGGTFDLFRITNGTVVRQVATAPLQFNHAPNFRSGLYIAGRPMSMTRTYPQQAPGYVTQSPVQGPDGSIQTEGPIVGTAPSPITQTATGFPFTTGMIVHSRTVPAPAQTFTLSGSDARTPGGFGDITLVAGATTQSAIGTEFPIMGIISVSVPEPARAIAIAFGALLVVSLATLRHARSARSIG